MLRDILHFGHTRTYLVLGPTAQIQPLGYDFCDIDVRTSDIQAIADKIDISRRFRN